MTRDEITRMARETGVYTYPEWMHGVPMVTLERFFHAAYAAGAAAERDKYEAKFKQLEAIMQAREQQPNKPCCLAEREACATYLERGVDLGGLAGHPGWQNYTADLLAGCASAIRARESK